MDATGASTSTGRNAGAPEVTASAEDATAGPSRPVGRADATGPLPIQAAPTDPTGPMPVPQAGSWFEPGTAADTAAQPAVTPAGSPPPWFATGPLPVVPADHESAAPPDDATPPAGAAAPPAAGGTPTDPVPQSGPAPASLFEPAAGPQPTAAPSTPPTGVIPVVGPPPPAVPTPPTEAIPAAPATDATPPAPAALFTPAAPPTAGAPADLFTPAAPPPHPAPPAPPEPPTGLFAAVAPQPTAPRAPMAPPLPPEPPTGLFAAVAPQPTAPRAPLAQPVPPEPPTGLFAAVAPAPVASPPPAEPARPADATGPMPAVGATVAPPVAPPPPPAPVGPPPPRAPEAPPRTDGRPVGSRSRPTPTPAGGGHSTGLTMVAGANTATKQTARRAWPLTVAGVLVAVAAGIALVFSVARANPADLAASAASEAGSWPGARYQGAVAADGGGEIRFDLTVTAGGASGTLTRDGGQAVAELLWDQGGTLIRADREWWLYHHPTRADDLAGAWVAEPATETREIDPILHLKGPALADFVRGEQPSQWQALEQQLVDGRSGVVLFDGARRVVVGSEDAHPLLALDVAPNANTPPVPVTRPTEEQVAAATGAAARVRQEAAPKTLAQLLAERPHVGIQLQPDPLCTAQACNVTVTVTNSGTAPARGRLEVSADGKVVANHPLDVQPGQVATFTASAPNPQFGQPGVAGRILWETKAVDD